MVPSRRPRLPPVEVSGLVNVGGRGTHLGEAPLPDAAENDHGASPEDDSSGCWFSWFSYHTPILQKKGAARKGQQQQRRGAGDDMHNTRV